MTVIICRSCKTVAAVSSFFPVRGHTKRQTARESFRAFFQGKVFHTGWTFGVTMLTTTGPGGERQFHTTSQDYLEIDMKRSITILFALFLLLLFSSAALAQNEKGKFLAKGDGIEKLPVTGEPISKSVHAEIFGRTIYLCLSLIHISEPTRLLSISYAVFC